MALSLSARILARIAAWVGVGGTWGHYDGQVQCEWLADGRRMRLLADLRYVDPNGKIWLAPKGWVVDGASIPKPFYSVTGGPFDGLYRNASVIHDVACDQRSSPWRDVHRVFYECMRCSGVSEANAKLMYFAVYHFGPRWLDASPAKLYGMGSDPQEVRLVTRRPAPPTEFDIDRTRDYLDAHKPSLADIERMKVGT